MKKTGDLKEGSKSDFDTTKQAEFWSEEGFEVSDKDNKDKLKKPQKIEIEREGAD